MKVGDETKNVTAEFSKEIKKQINVSVVRENEKLNNHEVYLITEQNWKNKVKPQVEKKHGSPEAGTYVEMKLTKKEWFPLNSSVQKESRDMLFMYRNGKLIIMIVIKWRMFLLLRTWIYRMK